MGQTTTLNDLARFSQQEKELLTNLGFERGGMNRIDEMPYQLEPKKETVENILNYSKALSIRSSAVIGRLEMILN